MSQEPEMNPDLIILLEVPAQASLEMHPGLTRNLCPLVHPGAPMQPNLAMHPGPLSDQMSKLQETAK